MLHSQKTIQYSSNIALKSGSVVLFFLGMSENAHAYLGPGVGLGAIGSILSIVIAVAVVVLGVIIYPIRKLLQHRSRKHV